MRKKIILIVLHFGKFNNYFPLWLHSCSYNPDINWLIFTDDKTSYNYPSNVKVNYTSFKEITEKIQNNFDFKISVVNPYLLCEFRIAYGEIFSDFLTNYDFWGYCDTDLIWGNLREHLTDDILERHSKISWRGHLTLYRNEARINSLYKKEVDGLPFYKYAFSNTSGFPLASDERQINYIFEDAGEKIYKELLFADLKILSFNFFISHISPTASYKNSDQVFYWEDGSLFRVYCENNIIYKESFAYIHFLKREMSIERNFVLTRPFLIIPNKFISTYAKLDNKMIVKLSRQRFYFSYFFSRLSFKYISSKLRYYYSKYLFKKNYPFLSSKGYHAFLPMSIKRQIFA